MKKKILAAMLAIAMSVSLVACAEKSDNNKKDSDTKVESSKDKDKDDKDKSDEEEVNEKSDESDDESSIEEVVEETSDPYAEIVNSTITLGNYEDRELTWIVLDVDETGKALVIIETRLEEKRVFSMKNATWDTSEIRTWLNDDFYNGAFSEKEQGIIYTTTVVTPGNDELGIAGIADTEDKVFLLSADEVNEYFVDEEGKVHYTCLDEWGKSGMWWLRTPGASREYGVNCSGRYGIEYESFKNTRKYICPAMYVDLSKIL